MIFLEGGFIKGDIVLGYGSKFSFKGDNDERMEVTRGYEHSVSNGYSTNSDSLNAYKGKFLNNTDDSPSLDCRAHKIGLLEDDIKEEVYNLFLEI